MKPNAEIDIRRLRRELHEHEDKANLYNSIIEAVHESQMLTATMEAHLPIHIEKYEMHTREAARIRAELEEAEESYFMISA
ncbi:MAG: hypothetical protein IKE43_06095 [Coriobacteriales bacterium]|nr:hypothetical protein [Coriobacteriales bacterium]